MTISIDRVGACPNPPTSVVEGYSPANGLAHGSLDVTVRVCDSCHPTVRQQIIDCGMTPYSISGAEGRECGDRITFGENNYTAKHSQ